MGKLSLFEKIWWKRKLNSYCNNKHKIIKKLEPIKKSIFIINIILFFSNIFLLLKKINSYSLFFKNSELFNINLLKRTYQYISAYLNNKYSINNKPTNSNEKKVIKFRISGSYNETYNLRWLKEKLSDKFILENDNQNPDYIIYNIFNDEDLKLQYQNIIRIAIYTENRIPDLNCDDYFISCFHINYLDRYFKRHLFPGIYFKEINSKRLEVLNSPTRTKFCAAITPIFNENLSSELLIFKIWITNSFLNNF